LAQNLVEWFVSFFFFTFPLFTSSLKPFHISNNHFSLSKITKNFQKDKIDQCWKIISVGSCFVLEDFLKWSCFPKLNLKLFLKKKVF